MHAKRLHTNNRQYQISISNPGSTDRKWSKRNVYGTVFGTLATPRALLVEWSWTDDYQRNSSRHFAIRTLPSLFILDTLEVTTAQPLPTGFYSPTTAAARIKTYFCGRQLWEALLSMSWFGPKCSGAINSFPPPSLYLQFEYTFTSKTPFFSRICTA